MGRLLAASVGTVVVAAACGGGAPGANSGNGYQEYECPAPVGKIVREECSRSALRYEGATFQGSVGIHGVGASASYKDEAIRQADALVSMLKEQRVQLCNDFNTCKVSVPEYRAEQRRLDDSFVALLALKDRMAQLDAEGATKLLAEIRRIRIGVAGGMPAVATASVDHVASAQPGTRCEITLPPEGCPLHAGASGTFNDTFEGSESNQARCEKRPLEYFYYCNDTGPVVGRFFDGETLVSEVKAQPATRCEISLPPEGCPLHAIVTGTFNDTFEGSESNQARCEKRAQEYFYYCNDVGPVVARYFDGKTRVNEVRAQPATRCEVVLPAEGCPLHAVVTGTFNDVFEGSEINQARCMNRASEFHAYCGSSQPVRTRFYNGRVVVKEETAR
jgi:hypothetical protein